MFTYFLDDLEVLEDFGELDDFEFFPDVFAYNQSSSTIGVEFLYAF